MFTNDKEEDVEMLRQLRLLYMPPNKIISMFYISTIVDKLESFLEALYVVLLQLYMNRVQKNQLLNDCV